MTTFALDTNIISYLLKDNTQVFKRYRQEIRYGNDIIIPPVAYYEIKRWLLLKNAAKQAKSFEQLYDEFGIGEMPIAVWDEAARLYAIHTKQGTPIGDADILIAAFCIVSGYTLVTHNTKDFENIEGLQLVDWTV